MWENENARKQHSAASRSKLVNYDQTDDLHAWSIFRQNLNAEVSENAIGINKSSNTERPFGHFQLKESTVNNILQHPKYGPRLKQDMDPYSYLKFGLPRAKFSNNQPLNSPSNHRHNHHQSSSSNLVLNHSNHQRLNYEPPINGTKNLRKSTSRHSLSSNEVEISSLNQIDQTTDQVDRSNHRTSQNDLKLNGKNVFNNGGGVGGRLNGSISNQLNGNDHRNDRRTNHPTKFYHSNDHTHHHQSQNKNRTNLIADEHVADSPTTLNHLNQHNNRHHVHEHAFTNQPHQNHHYLGNSFVDNGPIINQPKFPHLIVRNLYFEIDRTSKSRKG